MQVNARRVNFVILVRRRVILDSVPHVRHVTRAKTAIQPSVSLVRFVIPVNQHATQVCVQLVNCVILVKIVLLYNHKENNDE